MTNKYEMWSKKVSKWPKTMIFDLVLDKSKVFVKNPSDPKPTEVNIYVVPFLMASSL